MGSALQRKKKCMNQQELELLWLFCNYLSEMISTRLSDLVEEFIKYQTLHETLSLFCLTVYVPLKFLRASAPILHFGGCVFKGTVVCADSFSLAH